MNSVLLMYAGEPVCRGHMSELEMDRANARMEQLNMKSRWVRVDVSEQHIQWWKELGERDQVNGFDPVCFGDVPSSAAASWNPQTALEVA